MSYDTTRARGLLCPNRLQLSFNFHGTKRRHCLLLPSRTLPTQTHWRRPTRPSQIGTASQVERGVRRVLLRPDRVVRPVLDAWLALHGVVQRRVLYEPCAQREPARSETPLALGLLRVCTSKPESGTARRKQQNLDKIGISIRKEQSRKERRRIVCLLHSSGLEPSTLGM